jgi:hypothetical protein
MNKKWLPHVITAVAFVVFIVLGLACTSSPSAKWKDVVYHGENFDEGYYTYLTGTTWTYINRSSSSAQPTTVEFRSDGKLVMQGHGSGSWRRFELSTSTWNEETRKFESLKETNISTDEQLAYLKANSTVHIIFVTDDGYIRYDGRYDPKTKRILGEAESSNGAKWDFTMELVEGTSISIPSGAAPAASGSSQPASRTVSVTVYYELNGVRYPATYMVTASSANEAEEQGRRLWQNQFGYNAQAKFVSASAVWY